MNVEKISNRLAMYRFTCGWSEEPSLRLELTLQTASKYTIMNKTHTHTHTKSIFCSVQITASDWLNWSVLMCLTKNQWITTPGQIYQVCSVRAQALISYHTLHILQYIYIAHGSSNPIIPIILTTIPFIYARSAYETNQSPSCIHSAQFKYHLHAA